MNQCFNIRRHKKLKILLNLYDNLEVTGRTGGRLFYDAVTILKRMFRKRDSVDGIHLALCKDQWWGLVNTVIKFQIP